MLRKSKQKRKIKKRLKLTALASRFFGSQSVEMFKNKNSNVDNVFLDLDKNPPMSS